MCLSSSNEKRKTDCRKEYIPDENPRGLNSLACGLNFLNPSFESTGERIHPMGASPDFLN